MRRRTKICVFALISATVVVSVGLTTLRFVESTYIDHSRMFATAVFIEAYVKHQRGIPRSWDHAAFTSREYERKTGVRLLPQPFTFRELDVAVMVDWRQAQAVLNSRSAETASKAIISLRNGGSGLWHGNDANQMLTTFLRGHKLANNTQN